MKHQGALSLALVLSLSCGPEAPPVVAPRPAPAASSVPDASAPAPAPAAFGPARIDEALAAAWTDAGLTPAPAADDVTFLRRAYLDFTGTIPAPEIVVSFAKSAAPDKRAALIRTLTESPAYTEHWTRYWDDVLMGMQLRGQTVDRGAFRHWLRQKLRANTPWNTMVYELVSATGQNSTGTARIADNTPASPLPTGPGPGPEVNGAVNWTLKFTDAPADLPGQASRTFLGVQIQCAQCHDHKTEKWKQADFRRLANAFLHVDIDQLDKGPAKGIVRRVELKDAERMLPRAAKMADLVAAGKEKPTALDGADLNKGAGTRKALAAWVTSPQNPWFAKAIVNRMWGHFLGRGFTDPVDDFRESNPPTLPTLLDALAEDFVKHGYDLRHLQTTIALTRAYGLSASGSAKAGDDNRYWARFKLSPLGPEELVNALFAATDVETAAKRAGITNIDALRAQVQKSFTFLFDVDEEFDTQDYVGTVTQSLTLMNGGLVGYGSRALPGAMLAQVLAQNLSAEATIDAIYVRVLCRPATTAERARWQAHIDATVANPQVSAPSASVGVAPQGKPGKGPKKPAQDPLARIGSKAGPPVDAKTQAYEDLVWTLLNSSEFLFNH